MNNRQLFMSVCVRFRIGSVTRVISGLSLRLLSLPVRHAIHRLGLTLATTFFSVSALAATAVTPQTQVGDIVTNPVTNLNVTVLELTLDPLGEVTYAVTSDGNPLLAKTQVGDIINYTNATDPTPIVSYGGISVVTNADGLVVSVDALPSASDPATTIPVVAQTSVDFSVPPDSAGATGDSEYVAPTTTSGVIYEVSRGAK